MQRISTVVSEENPGLTWSPDIERLERSRRGWRRAVINFPPSWFAVVMGTGMSGVLLNQLPFNGAWLYWLSVIMYCLGIFLFALFSLASAIRYIVYPEIFWLMLYHPTQSLFLGCVPMAYSTLVMLFAYICIPAFGPWAVTCAWVLWWINVVVGVTTTLVVPFIMIYKHDEHSLSTVTGAWLLPVVPTTAATMTGVDVAKMLTNPTHAYWTVIICYVLLGISFPFCFIIFVIYFHRLAIFHLPSREVIVSVFLPLGPIGQTGNALIQLANILEDVNPKINALAPDIPRVISAVSIFLALFLFGHGVMWTFFAVASISRSKFPFNLGWWGFTFPVGAFALMINHLGSALPSRFFKYLGTVVSGIELVLWVFVFIMTIKAFFLGSITSPCAILLEEQIIAKSQVETEPDPEQVIQQELRDEISSDVRNEMRSWSSQNDQKQGNSPPKR